MRLGAVHRAFWVGAMVSTLTFAPGALGAAGALDPSFGTGGKVVVDLGDADEVGGIGMQGDKAVITGTTLAGPQAADLFALRLTAGGALDPSFGVGGSRIIDATAPATNAGVAVRPGGSVVLAAQTAVGANPDNLAVAQLTPQGAVDLGFGVAGIRVVDLGGHDFAFGPPALQADGAALVAGYRLGDFAVIRVNSAGTLDTAGFNPPSGFQFADVSGNDGAFAVAHQPDGKVLLAGSAAGDDDIALIRLTPAGAFDGTFGGNPIPGEVRINIGGSEERATSVALLSGGGILVAGNTNAGSGPRNLFVARLGPTGVTDTGFGNGGATIFDLGGDELAGAHTLAVQPDGKILVSGGSGGDLKVVRLTAGGSLDSSFGNGGVATIDSGGFDSGGRVAVQPDGKILVAGVTGVGVNPGNIVVARLESQSGADPTPPSASCAGKTATIVGSDGTETLTGTDADDVIAALGGNDKVNAGGGDDLVCGAAGNDALKGGAGKDKLLGEDGKDKLSGGGGKDKLKGGAGKDNCAGGGGKDKLSCEKEKK